MLKRISSLSFVCVTVLLVLWTDNFSQSRKSTAPVPEKVDAPKTEAPSFDFDSLLVIHFHPTAQCSCCINVGNFSKKGLVKFYPNLYKNRQIIFKECNIDEDSLTARKYKIFGSALGFKKIGKGKEEFSEIGSVWEFCEEEDKFLVNFRKELDSFIAGKKDEGVNNATK